MVARTLRVPPTRQGRVVVALRPPQSKRFPVALFFPHPATCQEPQLPFALKNRRIHIANRAIEVGTGWLPPMYDPRDYVATSPKMRSVVDQLEAGLKAKKSKVLQSPPSSMDLRAWCSPIRRPDATWIVHRECGNRGR